MTPTPRTVDELSALLRDGVPVEYYFFFGHQPRRPGLIDEACLSQWWLRRFTVGNLSFASAEHYMMWFKATLFGDEKTAAAILTTPTPKVAKALGRSVRGFDQATWDRHCFDAVVAGNDAKFGQHPDLAAFLLATGEKVLVEASPYDRIWGIGLAASDPRAAHPATWRGRNQLGFALMRTRDRLHGRDVPDRLDMPNGPQGTLW